MNQFVNDKNIRDEMHYERLEPEEEVMDNTNLQQVKYFLNDKYL